MGYFAGYANVARARSLGAELSLACGDAGACTCSCRAPAIDARDRSGDAARDGRRLPQQPALRAYVRPELRELPLGRQVAAGLYGELESTGRRFQDPANLVPPARPQRPGRGGLPGLPARRLRAVLSAYNLGNAAAPDVLDFPLPGRSFFLTLQFAYSQQETATDDSPARFAYVRASLLAVPRRSRRRWQRRLRAATATPTPTGRRRRRSRRRRRRAPSDGGDAGGPARPPPAARPAGLAIVNSDRKSTSISLVALGGTGGGHRPLLRLGQRQRRSCRRRCRATWSCPRSRSRATSWWSSIARTAPSPGSTPPPARCCAS